MISPGFFRAALGGLLPALLMTSGVYAQDDAGSATSASAQEVTRGLLRSEIFSVKPQAGVIAFDDAQGNNTSRLAAGITLDMNAVQALSGSQSPWYIGPVIGAIASHLGDPTSNFVGSSSNISAGQAGANLLIIPTNLKLGYAISENLRISAHGGGNGIYRSVANSMPLGAGSQSSSSLWKYYPNIGGDVDIVSGKSVSILLRPDWTLAPDNSVFTGTLGIGIMLG